MKKLILSIILLLFFCKSIFAQWRLNDGVQLDTVDSTIKEVLKYDLKKELIEFKKYNAKGKLITKYNFVDSTIIHFQYLSNKMIGKILFSNFIKSDTMNLSFSDSSVYVYNSENKLITAKDYSNEKLINLTHYKYNNMNKIENLIELDLIDSTKTETHFSYNNCILEQMTISYNRGKREVYIKDNNIRYEVSYGDNSDSTKITGMVIYEYENNNMTQISVVHSNYCVSISSDKMYYNDKNKIYKKEYIIDSSILYTHYYYYNKKGLLKEIKYYNHKLNKKGTAWTYKYVYW